MTTTIDHNKADVYSRPNARFDGDGQLEIRASAAGNCRRALWYEATGYEVTNPKTEDTLTMLEAGNALEPVVLRAMERAGWEVTPADPQDPQQVSVRVGPNMLVTGHPDATGVMPLFGGEAVPPRGQDQGAGGVQAVAHPGRGAQPPGVGGPGRLLHPGDLRGAAGRGDRHDGHRQPQWDYEVIPAARVETALDDGPPSGSDSWALTSSSERAGPRRAAGTGLLRHGLAVQVLSLPGVCLPGDAAEAEGEPEPAEDAEPVEPVTDEAGAERAPRVRGDPGHDPGVRGREAVGGGQAPGLAGAGGGSSRGGRRPAPWAWSRPCNRYSVDYRRLNNLLDPETRSEIVTENVSEYLRVS